MLRRLYSVPNRLWLPLQGEAGGVERVSRVEHVERVEGGGYAPLREKNFAHFANLA